MHLKKKKTHALLTSIPHPFLSQPIGNRSRHSLFPAAVYSGHHAAPRSPYPRSLPPPTEPSRVLNHAAPQTLAAPLPALAPAHEDGADRSTDFWSHPELFQTLAPEDDHAATSRRASIRHPSEPLLVHGNHQGRRRRASSGTAASPAYWRDHPGPWTRPFRDLQDLGPKPHLHAAVLEHILPPQRCGWQECKPACAFTAAACDGSGGPREDVTHIDSSGVLRTHAVYIFPLRRYVYFISPGERAPTRAAPVMVASWSYECRICLDEFKNAGRSG
nr:uncharacterized protein LOC127304158 [Lolium perenne]